MWIDTNTMVSDSCPGLKEDLIHLRLSAFEIYHKIYITGASIHTGSCLYAVPQQRGSGTIANNYITLPNVLVSHSPRPQFDPTRAISLSIQSGTQLQPSLLLCYLITSPVSCSRPLRCLGRVLINNTRLYFSLTAINAGRYKSTRV